MLIDVTMSNTSEGEYSYWRHMCESPKYGVESKMIGVSGVELTYAVTWFNDIYEWETRMWPSESLAKKFAKKLTEPTDSDVFISPITKESS